MPPQNTRSLSCPWQGNRTGLRHSERLQFFTDQGILLLFSFFWGSCHFAVLRNLLDSLTLLPRTSSVPGWQHIEHFLSQVLSMSVGRAVCPARTRSAAFAVSLFFPGT